MTTAMRTHDVRSHRASEALARLPHGGKEQIVLRVHCNRSHHVAVVYDVATELVYVAPVRPRSHGARDLPDEPHGKQRSWVDFVAVPGVEDALPAWCDCGHRTLSRRAILEWVRDGEHRVIVD